MIISRDRQYFIKYHNINYINTTFVMSEFGKIVVKDTVILTVKFFDHCFRDRGADGNGCVSKTSRRSNGNNKDA